MKRSRIIASALGSVVLTLATIATLQPDLLGASPMDLASPCPTGNAHYSPHVVAVDGSPFHVISFKDVGLGVDSADASEALQADLALALAGELEERAFGTRVSVAFSEDAGNAETHCACEGHHLYVDLWRSNTPPGWGYSLWSGCTEESRFAWREVQHGSEAESKGQAMGSIAQQIANDLDTAVYADCFRRTC